MIAQIVSGFKIFQNKEKYWKYLVVTFSIKNELIL